MIVHHILDPVFTARSHTAVLRELQNVARGLTGREIARLAGINHQAALNALTALEDAGIVSRYRGGRDHIFVLNRENILVAEGILPLLSLESSWLVRIKQALKRKLGKKSLSMILFGSVARKEEGPESDFDVCFVVESVAEKNNLQNDIHSIAPSLRSNYGINLAPFIITAAEFKKRAMSGKPPINEVVNDGIVLHGKTMSELIHG